MSEKAKRRIEKKMRVIARSIRYVVERNPILLEKMKRQFVGR